jgi:Lar family restriction alleviation protein
MTKLRGAKGCPFCGSVDAPMIRGGLTWWVECYEGKGGCGAEGPAGSETRAEAIATWNRRAAGEDER